LSDGVVVVFMVCLDTVNEMALISGGFPRRPHIVRWYWT
jgi:hypothetical protein